ncbi:U3 small nucleolar ribonucleoprotein protein MPP10-like isoform X2 [Varroa jacobsoni]|uniref:U3 small nucleolar ribonucleoprotein protein MPP10-like isoform X2 n=1 Tax=Varroa jacobsoni TaxID=62625 RepID=UPI000BFA1899|nr:U3 small nucleolar ribonucleoprotein protein MPP10-like isoform X2 [Varroa jacobsoni]
MMAPGTSFEKNVFSYVDSEVESLTQDITQFLKKNDKSADKFRQLSKSLYDGLKRDERCLDFQSAEDLDQLIVEEFDDEQIWQELELRNEPLFNVALAAVARLGAKTDLDFGIELEKESANGDEELHDEEVKMGSEDEDLDKDEELGLEAQAAHGNKKSKEGSVFSPAPRRKALHKTAVDDNFFSLGALEEFLNSEDQREQRKMNKKRQSEPELEKSESEDDEWVDYYGNFTSDDEGCEAKYEDFFDPIVDLRELENQEKEKDNDDPASCKLKASEGRKSVRFIDEEVSETEDDDKSGDDYDGYSKTEMDEKDNNYDLRDAEDEDVENNELEGALKTTRDLFKDSDDNKTEDENKMSTFEKNEKKLRERITKLEEVRLAEKGWQMRGEVSAKNRPENSLMEEHLDFDHQTRQAPQITRTLTQKLEDWILQRIKDKAWDDVVRKVKPTEEVFEFRRRLTLDQEKSKVGLAEVYEQEFLKMKEGEKEATNPEYDEIKKLMGALFKQLDALSNYHFMPRPAQAELKLINNLPTIAVEEVAPATVSDATMLAPEEIREKPKREVLAKDERSKTDKNRERRLKKIHQRRKRFFEEEKQKKRAERDLKFRERLERKTARENLRNSTNTKVLKTPKERDSGLKSSTKFFQRLEDQLINQVDAKKKAQKQRELKRVRVGSLKL